jgi:hypothetical protein
VSSPVLDSKKTIEVAVNRMHRCFGEKWRDFLKTPPKPATAVFRRLYWHPFDDPRLDARVQRARKLLALDGGWQVPPCPYHRGRCQDVLFRETEDSQALPAIVEREVYLLEINEDLRAVAPPLPIRLRRSPSAVMITMCNEEGGELSHVKLEYRDGAVTVTVSPTSGGTDDQDPRLVAIPNVTDALAQSGYSP